MSAANADSPVSSLNGTLTSLVLSQPPLLSEDHSPFISFARVLPHCYEPRVRI